MERAIIGGHPAGKTRVAQRLLSALAAAGLPRLDVSLDWHAPVWAGRPRPRRIVDNGVRVLPELYRPTQSAKFRRRFHRRFAKLTQNAI